MQSSEYNFSIFFSLYKSFITFWSRGFYVKSINYILQKMLNVLTPVFCDYKKSCTKMIKNSNFIAEIFIDICDQKMVKNSTKICKNICFILFFNFIMIFCRQPINFLNKIFTFLFTSPISQKL